MKYAKSFLISMTILTGISVHTSYATNESTSIVKEMSISLAMLNQFKTLITNFFNDNKQESYTQHKAKFAGLIRSANKLITEAEQAYASNNSKKYKLFLDLLKEIKRNLDDLYNVLSTNHKNAKVLGEALEKILSKYKSPAHKKKIDAMLNNLKELLNSKELETIAKIIKTLDSSTDSVPKNRIKCFLVLNKIYKRG